MITSAAIQDCPGIAQTTQIRTQFIPSLHSKLEIISNTVVKLSPNLPKPRRMPKTDIVRYEYEYFERIGNQAKHEILTHGYRTSYLTPSKTEVLTIACSIV